ncbi:MAG: tyrosine-type recombinase/integrase [bacterium]
MKKAKLSKKKVKIRNREGKLEVFWKVISPKLGGGSNRRFFKDETEADTHLELQKIQLANFGTAALSISEKLRVEATSCEERLRAHGATLTQATDFYLAHLEATIKSVSVADAVAAVLKAKDGAGMSDLYLRDLKWRLGRLSQAFPDKRLAEISTDDIQGFLDGLGVGAVTRNTFRRDIRTLWGYAAKRNWARMEVAANTEAAKATQKKPDIFTPHQVAALLSTDQDDDLLAFHAIGLFAGLRVSEINRLSWDDVDLTGGFIHVSAANSKTRTRRLVPIQANLKGWLEPIAKTKGPIINETVNPKTVRPRSAGGTFGKTGEPGTFRRRHAAVIKAAGLTKWPVNVMRHSFVSYRLAETQDAGKTALESGHDQAILFAHYRELVKPQAAKLYWSISPTQAENIESIGKGKAA